MALGTLFIYIGTYVRNIPIILTLWQSSPNGAQILSGPQTIKKKSKNPKYYISIYALYI